MDFSRARHRLRMQRRRWPAEHDDLPAIADAIDAGTAGSLSDTEVRSASLEVGRAIREKP